LFLKQDGKYGENGPICPTTGFDEVCRDLFSFETKYKGNPTLHPLREPLFKYSHVETPGAPSKSSAEKNEDEQDLHEDFK